MKFRRVLNKIFGALLATCAFTACKAPSPLPTGTLPPPPPGANASLDSARAVRGQTLSVSLVTYGPGEDVWERFGHDAIEIRDTVTKRDVVYNWGMFDFNSPDFYVRFLTGDTKYWMVGAYTSDFNANYVHDNRSIRVQHLALTPTERAAIADFVDWNSLEENKFYRYDYYRDNCSTRARDAIDRILDGRLKATLDTGTTSHTYRGETERATESDPLVYPGIEMALGRDADKPLSRWGESFIPARFADDLDGLAVRNREGLRYRLVDHDSIVFASTRVPLPIDPPERLSMAALLGLTIAGIIAFLVDSRFKFLRRFLALFVTLWFLVGGVLGTALLLAGTVTKHASYMGHNLTLWQLNPLLLIAAVVVPYGLFKQHASSFARTIAIVVAALSIVGALLQLVPALAQRSGMVILVILPVHIAIAAAMFRMNRDGSRRTAGAAALSRAA